MPRRIVLKEMNRFTIWRWIYKKPNELGDQGNDRVLKDGYLVRRKQCLCHPGRPLLAFSLVDKKHLIYAVAYGVVISHLALRAMIGGRESVHIVPNAEGKYV